MPSTHQSIFDIYTGVLYLGKSHTSLTYYNKASAGLSWQASCQDKTKLLSMSNTGQASVLTTRFVQQSYAFYSEKWIYAHIHTGKEKFAPLLSLHSLTVTQFSRSLKISLFFCAQSYQGLIVSPWSYSR